MSFLATAGRANIYNTDGTGRDTYIGSNSGGFTIMNQPTIQQKSSAFSLPAINVKRSGLGMGTPAKPLHYHNNGTGRDSYIYANHGGFTSNYSQQNAADAYVSSLRTYSKPLHELASRNMSQL